LSYSIPQVNISPDGHLIPNPGENLVSQYEDVHYEKWEGEVFITDSRFVWIGKQHKGSFLGKLAKAAVVVGAAAVAASAASKAGRSFGIPPRVAGVGGGVGGAVVGLSLASMMSKHQDGTPTTISVPYEVVVDVQAAKDRHGLMMSTQVGSFNFKFNKGGADTVATVLKAQKLNAQKRGPAPVAPPYQPAPQYQPQYQPQPPPAYGYPQPPRGGGNFCPHCGTPLEPGARFCQNCGARVD
jgi:hypothetical protein